MGYLSELKRYRHKSSHATMNIFFILLSMGNMTKEYIYTYYILKYIIYRNTPYSLIDTFFSVYFSSKT